jgi:tetratricopeptide (TPR) repeat protein
MADMFRTEDVYSWITWSRENLPEKGDIPPINWPEKEVPWGGCGIDLFDNADDDAFGDRYKFVAVFEGALTRDLQDLPVRFTALSVYYSLSRFDPIFKEDVIADVRERHEKTLEYLVRLVKPEDCFDWRTIRWEILNSYSIRDWGRALKFYERAEEMGIKDQAQIQAMRGQFRFLVVFGDEFGLALDSLDTEPQIHEAREKPGGALRYFALSARRPETRLGLESLDTLKDAANDLDKAVGKRPDLPPVYTAMLATCNFLTGRFQEAAGGYERLLNEGDADFPCPELMKQLTYHSIVASYRNAEQTERAIHTCERWVSEFPNTTLAYKQLAELHELRSEYQTANDCLRKVVELNPSEEKDFRTRIALAFGGILKGFRDISTCVKDHLASNRETSGMLDSILGAYWPSFQNLGEQPRSEWRTGTYLLYYVSSLEPAQRERLNEAAVKSFAKVVELELEARVFEPFREEVAKSAPGKRCFVLNGEAPAWLRCLGRYLDRNAELNLEKMTQILKKSQNTKEEIGTRFASWIRQNRPAILQQVKCLGDILKPRGDATHERMLPELAEKVAVWCRAVLDMLVSSQPA